MKNNLLYFNKGDGTMHTKRIIPCLDVRNGKVVKGINFLGIKEVGVSSAVRRILL